MSGKNQRIVTSWVLGGLGNQLFQYAIGASIAYQTGARLQIDRTAFDGYQRSYALPRFGLALEEVSTPSFGKGVGRAMVDLRDSLARRGLGQPPSFRTVREPAFAWSPIELEGWQHLYLRGYWQSYKYFEPIAERLRCDLALHRFAVDSCEPALASTSRDHSVAVHIRRGDYASDPQAMATHGLLSKEWYDAAVTLMKKIVPAASFHVFSDDPQVGQMISKGWGNTEVHPVREPEQDLMLLSNCQHKIIANSTFSWWGAWLSHRGGEVIAPRQWFARSKQIQTYVGDLFPPGWILI